MLTIGLAVIYYFGGMLLAVVGAMCLGFILSVFVVLCNLFAYRWSWLVLLICLAGAVLSYGIILLILNGAGYLGDHTAYRMQTMLFIGGVFPGIFALKIVPAYIRLASRLSRGNLDIHDI